MQKGNHDSRISHMECSLDIGEPAAFVCDRCKKPFCESCIGRKECNKTLCLHCTVVEDSKEEKARQASPFLTAEKKHTFTVILGVLAGIAIIINLYILYNDFREKSSSNTLASSFDTQLAEIIKCRSNMEALVKAATTFRESFERPPSSLEEIASLLDDPTALHDPVTQEPYILDVDHKGKIEIHCPTPDAHGVADIIAIPGKPARMIYGSRSEQ